VKGYMLYCIARFFGSIPFGFHITVAYTRNKIHWEHWFI